MSLSSRKGGNVKKNGGKKSKVRGMIKKWEVSIMNDAQVADSTDSNDAAMVVDERGVVDGVGVSVNDGDDCEGKNDENENVVNGARVGGGGGGGGGGVVGRSGSQRQSGHRVWATLKSMYFYPVLSEKAIKVFLKLKIPEKSSKVWQVEEGQGGGVGGGGCKGQKSNSFPLRACEDHGFFVGEWGGGGGCSGSGGCRWFGGLLVCSIASMSIVLNFRCNSLEAEQAGGLQQQGCSSCKRSVSSRRRRRRRRRG